MMLARWWRSVRPSRRDLRREVVAGLPGAIASVPDGMASGVLAGVSPVHGLYASMAGPAAGGLLSSTRAMVITTTSAAALAAGSALQGVDADQRSQAMFLLTVLAGAVMAAAGLLRLGRYTRFVSHSVMMGFLTGVAVNIVAGQIPDLSGAEASGSTSLAKAFDVIVHPSRIDLPSVLTGLAAIGLLVGLRRTRVAPVRAVVAMVVPTIVILVAGAVGVATVNDVGAVPSGLPLPTLPDLGLLSPELIMGALSVAAIVLVQGVGVAESAPNRDGTRSDPNVDFVAQGTGNIAAGLLRGMPVGGSVGQTALNVTAGARTRWAGVFSGLWMAAILLLFSRLVGEVAMPTLAAILIVAAIGSVRVGELATIMRTGRISQLVLLTTLLATLLLSIPAAVGIGVALSLILQLNRESMDLKVVELTPTDHAGWVEGPAPRELRSHDVTIIDVYGSLFHAGARTLQARLPTVADAESPVVVLRLRGRTSAGATCFLVLADYAKQLERVGGRLYLSGVDRALAAQMRQSGRVDIEGPVEVFGATEKLGASTRSAYQAAESWLVRHPPGGL